MFSIPAIPQVRREVHPEAPESPFSSGMVLGKESYKKKRPSPLQKSAPFDSPPSSRDQDNTKASNKASASELLKNRRNMRAKLQNAASARGVDNDTTTTIVSESSASTFYSSGSHFTGELSVMSNSLSWVSGAGSNQTSGSTQASSRDSHGSSTDFTTKVSHVTGANAGGSSRAVCGGNTQNQARRQRVPGGSSAKLVGSYDSERDMVVPPPSSSLLMTPRRVSSKAKPVTPDTENSSPDVFFERALPSSPVNSYTSIIMNPENIKHEIDDGSIVGGVSILGMMGVEDVADSDEEEVLKLYKPSRNWDDEDVDGETGKAAAKKYWRQMNRTKREFLEGKHGNRRYWSEDETVISEEVRLSDKMSEASVPSLLCRTDVFHENAAAAIASLLGPPSPGNHNHEARSKIAQKGLSVDHLHSSTQPSKDSPSKIKAKQELYRMESPSWDKSRGGTRERSKNVSTPFLTPHAEAMMERIYDKMIQPSKQFSDLLSAIHRPIGVNNKIKKNDRSFVIRRKNACGALKLLTSKVKNRRRICWTVGVLSSITSVLKDSGTHGPENEYHDKDTLIAYLATRTRALSSLFYMCQKVENRILIFHSPGLTPALGNVLRDASDESLCLACSCLAYLSKEPENRLLMFQVPRMIDAMMTVIQPPAVQVKKEVIGMAGYRNRFLDVYMEDDSDCEYDCKEAVDDDSCISSSSSSEAEHDLHGHDDESSTSSRRTHEDKFGTNLDVVTRILSRISNASTPRKGNKAEVHEWEIVSHGSSDCVEVNCKVEALEGVELSLPVIQKEYDCEPNQYLVGARVNVFAILVHVCKASVNSYCICRNEPIMRVLLNIAKMLGSPSHAKAVAVLAQISRHPDNAPYMVNRIPGVLATLVNATLSPVDDCRKHACFAIQNLSCDHHCRQVIANENDLLYNLSKRALSEGHDEEQFAAVCALKNLSDEPSCLIPMTNTPHCIAALMQVAHEANAAQSEKTQLTACDALATLSHWLRKIATNGSYMEMTRRQVNDCEDVFPSYPIQELFVPTLRSVTWNQWQ